MCVRDSRPGTTTGGKIDVGEKSSERLAETSRRGAQRIRSGVNRRPRLNLDISRLANVRLKPLGDEWLVSLPRVVPATETENKIIEGILKFP